MDFYILPKSIPRVDFAHVHSTDNYHIPLHTNLNFMEITYYESGTSFCDFADGTQRTQPPESVSIHTFKQDVLFHGIGEHRHHTVGFVFCYDIVPAETPNSIHLCDLITDRVFVNSVASIIRNCERDFMLERNNTCKTTAHVFELFALYQHYFENLSLMSAHPVVNYGAIRYVKQAKEYILHNLSQKLSVDAIAAHLRLSRGYLSLIFKKICGMSLIRYINDVRLETVKNLVLNESASLSEACAFVGIDDPNYISRMFRKYYGTTISEIKSRHR